jgi:hypothetical protein
MELEMNWDAIGAIGEVVGALAVFITLGYLAVQIRQNTKAVRASALDSGVNSVNAVRVAMFENAEVASFYTKGLESPDNLDVEERVRFRILLHTIFWAVWNLYAQATYGGLSATTWTAQVPLVVRILDTPGGAWFWSDYRMEFEEAFRQEVEKIMEEHETSHKDSSRPSSKD